MEALVYIVLVMGMFIGVTTLISGGLTFGYIEAKHRVRTHMHRPEAFDKVIEDINLDIQAMRSKGDMMKANACEAALDKLLMELDNAKINREVWDVMDKLKELRSKAYSTA